MLCVGNNNKTETSKVAVVFLPLKGNVNFCLKLIFLDHSRMHIP